jgi:hypothetical protein
MPFIPFDNDINVLPFPGTRINPDDIMLLIT